MKFGHKIVAVACAGALAMMGVVPAFAADESQTVNTDGNSADVKISAAVAKAGDKIISVTVPSQMAIAITTHDTTDGGATVGAFKEFKSSPATVTNNAVSTNAVQVDVAKVSQKAGQDSNGKLLSLVNLNLVGDDTHTVTLSEDTADAPLIASMGINSSYTLQLEAAAVNPTTVIPTDSYTVNATLKVTALDTTTP